MADINTADTKKDKIIQRIEDNYDDFRYSLRGASREKLFDMAPRIAAVTDAYNYLRIWHDWDDRDELDFYLLFRDPLTIIADAWESRRAVGIFDVSEALTDVSRSGGVINKYPLADGIRDDIVYIGGDD
jgi:hypothetical protein